MLDEITASVNAVANIWWNVSSLASAAQHPTASTRVAFC